MSKNRKKIWLTLLIVLLILIGTAIAMAWSLPARFVYERYGERVQPLRLQGIEGTLWSGKAAMASYAARPLGPVQWHLDPWSLLRGSVAGKLILAGPEGQADSAFVLKRGRAELASARARFPASMLAPALDIPSLSLLGEIQVDMRDVVIEDGLLKIAVGQMVWENLGVSGAAEARLGKLVVDFAPTSDGAIVGEVRDDGGPLKASGRVELRGLNFKTDVQLSARPGNERIQEALLYVGQRAADGGSVLRVEGTIEKFF